MVARMSNKDYHEVPVVEMFVEVVVESVIPGVMKVFEHQIHSILE